jgi:hypothetical protein
MKRKEKEKKGKRVIQRERGRVKERERRVD